MRTLKRLGMFVLALCILAAWAPAQDTKTDQEAKKDQQSQQTTTADPMAKIKASPGYLDISTNDVFSGLKTKAEVTLEKTMLQMVKAAGQENNMDIANLIDKLDLVRVLVFESNAEKAGEVGPKIDKITQSLRSEKGWTPLVRVSEASEKVDIFMKIEDERVRGIGLFVQEPGEIVFINIVCDIKSEEFAKNVGGLIGKLAGGKLDMAQLTQLMGAAGAIPPVPPSTGEKKSDPMTIKAVKIIGIVTASASGDPLPGATIKVTKPDGEMIKTVSTDDKGMYEIEVPVKEITLIVLADKYKPHTKKLTEEALNTDRPVVIDFALDEN